MYRAVSFFPLCLLFVNLTFAALSLFLYRVSISYTTWNCVKTSQCLLSYCVHCIHACLLALEPIINALYVIM
jgi:hypothetical protein